MRVLVQIRPNESERSGGDTLHAERKAEELRAFGVQIDVSGALNPDPSGYDLVHLYNTTWIEPTFRRALRARGCGVTIVVETIHWDTSALHPPVVFQHHEGMRRIVLGLAERLIPSSRAEAVGLEQRFPGTAGRIRVVPVGVDALPLAGGDASAFCARHGLEPGFVLCAARKELRKNQLRLIRACGRLGVPLVLAGGEHVEEATYLAECRAAAALSGAGVRFLPHLEGAELAGAYAAARVHAQPSIWETVGLSSLEAALAGCNVVSTRESGLSEYLGDDAWYCDPLSEDSIAAAVAAALAAPPPNGVAERLRERFSWRGAAERTLVAYEEAMAEHNERGGRPAIPQDQYVEHLEELVQLQLEAIAFRDETLGGLTAQEPELERLRVELAEALEQLERVHQTKVLRWSAPVRALYARVRGS